MLQKHLTEEAAKLLAEQNPESASRYDTNLHSLAYSSRYAINDIPKFQMPVDSVEPSVAYQLVHDELELDGRPAMNCASFVHTWMEPEADKIIMENIAKNLCDQDEYPATIRIQARCISIIGNLWNAKEAIGTPTVGSSEAIMLGGLAMKKRWQERRKAEGKDTLKPNIIMGSNAQVALEKFARFFDVEARLIPVSKESNYVLDIHKALEACDENTIGIFVILGSTYTGHFEDVKGMSDLLDQFEKDTGIDIPIHVDAASGGFVAPFAFPDHVWDFKLPRVVSINGSGHKFGLSYAGIGWVLWRSEKYLPESLIFELHYLGGVEYSYTINFSRPACFMLSQYYNFIRLGRKGYTRIIENDLCNARLLSESLEKSGFFEVISDVHHLKNAHNGHHYETKEKSKGKKTNSSQYIPSLPVVSFKLTDEFMKKHSHVKQSAISMLIRTKGWIVPNYQLPPNEKAEILRVVVRESLSRDMTDRLFKDIIDCTKKLMSMEGVLDPTVYVPKESHNHFCFKRAKRDDSSNQAKRSRTYSRTC